MCKCIIIHVRVPHSAIGLFLLDLVQQKPQTRTCLCWFQASRYELSQEQLQQVQQHGPECVVDREQAKYVPR